MNNTILLLHCEDFIDDSYNNIKIRNKDITFTEGKFDKAFSLSSSLKSELDYSLPSTASSNLTIECWVYMSSTGQSSYPTIMSTKKDSGRGVYFHFLPNLTKFFVNRVELLYSSPFPRDVWTHVAFVINNNIGSAYINGERVATGTTFPVVDIDELNIGRLMENGASVAGTHFTGKLDDIRISNIARYTGESFTVPSKPYLVRPHIDTVINDNNMLRFMIYMPEGADLNSYTFTVNGIERDLNISSNLYTYVVDNQHLSLGENEVKLTITYNTNNIQTKTWYINYELNNLEMDAPFIEIVNNFKIIETVTKNNKDFLSNNLSLKGVEVSPTDTMLDLVNKVQTIKPFPTGWDIVKSGEVLNDTIKEGDAVAIGKYGTWEDTITKLDSGPTSKNYNSSFSADGKYLTVACLDSPYIRTYKIENGNFTLLPDPSEIPTSKSYNCCFSPDNKYLAVVQITAPYINIYKKEGDIFIKLPDPDILPTDAGYSCNFSPDSKYLVVGHSKSPYITIYKRDGDIFTKLDDPSVLPKSTVYSISFSPDNTHLVVGHSTSPGIAIYKISGDTFNRLPDPSVLPTGSCYDCSFTPDGNYLAIGTSYSPYIITYKRDGDIFTKLPNPVTLPVHSVDSCPFSADGNYLALAIDASPHLIIYKRDGDTFIKLPVFDSSLPGISYCCKFSPDNKYLITGYSNSPYTSIYKPSLKDVVIKYNATAPSIHHLEEKNIGISLENKAKGKNIKINTFPKFEV